VTVRAINGDPLSPVVKSEAHLQTGAAHEPTRASTDRRRRPERGLVHLSFGERVEGVRPAAHDVAGEEWVGLLECPHDDQQFGEAVLGVTSEVGGRVAQQSLMLPGPRVGVAWRCAVMGPDGRAGGVRLSRSSWPREEGPRPFPRALLAGGVDGHAARRGVAM